MEVKDRTRETRPSHACMTCLSVVLECTTAPSVLPVTHAALAVEFPTQPLQRSRMQQKCNRRNETLTAVTSGCMQSMISSSRQPTSDHLLSLSLFRSPSPSSGDRSPAASRVPHPPLLSCARRPLLVPLFTRASMSLLTLSERGRGRSRERERDSISD